VTDTTKNTSQSHWFYSLVADPATTNNAVAAPPVIEPQSSDAETDADEGSTTAKTDTVGALWLEGTPPAEVAWTAEPVAEPKRSFRIWTLIVWIGIIALLVTGVTYAYFQPQRAADTTRSEYTAALVDLHNEMRTAQSVLDTVTGSDSTTEALATAYAPLGSFDVKAGAVRDFAVAPLPEAWPLVPTGPIDDLAPIRSELGLIATAADDVSTRLETTLEYRSSLASVANLPELPSTADTGRINALSVELASYLADTTTVANGLPIDPSFADHRELLRTWLGDLAELQVTYLDALRNGDEPAAVIAINAILEGEVAVEVSLIETLSNVRISLDALILNTADAIAKIVNT
jgi:hypothetical protein